MDLRKLQAEYHIVTQEKLVVGAIVRTELGEEDGLVLKSGATSRTKMLVIVGVDAERGLCYGSLLINTRINPRAEFSEAFLQTQYVLRQEVYSHFLRYDSHLDCAKIFSIQVEKLLSGTYLGILEQDDKDAVFQLLKSTVVLSAKLKRRFGILPPK